MTTSRDPMAVDPPAPALNGAGTRSSVPGSGPWGLSDYAVSPLGMPAALLQGEVRVAFLGRCSTEDQQDPRQSLMRQLTNCKAAIPGLIFLRQKREETKRLARIAPAELGIPVITAPR